MSGVKNCSRRGGKRMGLRQRDKILRRPPNRRLTPTSALTGGWLWCDERLGRGGGGKAGSGGENGDRSRGGQDGVGARRSLAHRD